MVRCAKLYVLTAVFSFHFATRKGEHKRNGHSREREPLEDLGPRGRGRGEVQKTPPFSARRSRGREGTLVPRFVTGLLSVFLR